MNEPLGKIYLDYDIRKYSSKLSKALKQFPKTFIVTGNI